MDAEETVWYLVLFCIVFTIVYLFWDLILLTIWSLRLILRVFKCIDTKSSSRSLLSSSRSPFLDQEGFEKKIQAWKGDIKRPNLKTTKVVKGR